MSPMMLLSIAVLVMLSAGGIAYVLLYGRIEQENVAARRLALVQGRGVDDGGNKARAAVDANKRRKSVQETLKELEAQQKAKARNSKSPPLSVRLQQAGLTWSKQTFWLISAACGLVAFLLSWLFGAPAYAAAAFGVAGMFGLPRWFINRQRKRRMRKFVDEFANAVDVIVRGVKAGLPLNDCVRIIANEAAEPVKSEFRQITEAQQVLGLSLPEAVARMPERVPVAEAGFFSIVVGIQTRTGGNLSEALGNLSRVLRERKKMKGKIAAMSMEAKASAWIIGALPVIVLVLVYLTSPGYIMLLFTTSLGNLILGASALWMFIGVVVMRRMINFDY